MAHSRSLTVPELPLFSTIASDLPIDETSSTTGINSSLATDIGCSTRRHMRHSRRNKKVPITVLLSALQAYLF